ncbi:MAG: hypothetical protein AAF152_15235 [Cyanobacteria bacterium P01_A01_bin.114]
MSTGPKKTPDFQFAEADEADVVRKPVILPTTPDDDDDDDGSRSTKNDREIKVGEEAAEQAVEKTEPLEPEE